MIAIGRALTIYLLACTFATSLIIVLSNLKDLFKSKEERQKKEEEYEEYISGNSEEMLSIRYVFGDLHETRGQLLFFAFVSYIPGVNLICWKAAIMSLLGFDKKEESC